METKTKISEKVLEALGFTKAFDGYFVRRVNATSGNEYVVALQWRNSTENWSVGIKRSGYFSADWYDGFWEIDGLKRFLNNSWGLAI